MGTGGDPLLAETQQQTKFLENIDAQITTLNDNIQKSKGGLVLK